MVKNLEHAKRFVLPRIASENAESNGGPNEKLEPVSATNRVNLDVLAQYTPATEEELKKAAKPEKAAAEPAAREKASTPALPAPHPVPAVKPRAGVKTPAQANAPEEPGPGIPLRRPAAPYPTLRPGQGMPNQWQPPRPSTIPMTGVSRPPQPRQPNPPAQPNQGGPQ
jgi:hypothetical protein